MQVKAKIVIGFLASATIIFLRTPISANTINNYLIQQGLPHAQITTSIWKVSKKPNDGNTHLKIGNAYSGFPTYNYGYADNMTKPNKVIIHETANEGDNGDTAGEIAYMKNHYGDAFVHSFVSGTQIVNIADTDYLAWGSGYFGNLNAVQFEQVRVNSKTAFAKQVGNVAYYTAYLLQKYSLTPSAATQSGAGTVWSHHNVTDYLGGTDHTDPDGYWKDRAGKYWNTSYTMTDFLPLVKKYYAQKNLIKNASYNKVVKTKTVNYRIMINEDSRNDALYYGGPYNTSGQSVSRGADAKKYNHQVVTVVAESQTNAQNGVVWLKFKLGNQYVWMNKLGAKKLNEYTQKTTTNYKGIIQQNNRNDGLYWHGAYNVSSSTQTRDEDAILYNGKDVTVVQEAKTNSTNGVKWAEFRINNRLVWMDSRGIKKYNLITKTTPTSYTATITEKNRNDGLYWHGPYNISVSTQTRNDDAKLYDGQKITVVKEVNTDSTNGVTWVEFRLGDRLVWMDKRGLTLD